MLVGRLAGRDRPTRSFDDPGDLVIFPGAAGGNRPALVVFHQFRPRAGFILYANGKRSGFNPDH